MQIEAIFSILTRFEWFLYEILVDHANSRHLFNFDSFLNGFRMKSYWTTQIEGTFSISTRFRMVFERTPTWPRKSKQPFKFQSDFEWFLYEILLDHANPSKLFNFDSFLNGFWKKSY